MEQFKETRTDGTLVGQQLGQGDMFIPSKPDNLTGTWKF